MQQYDLLGCFRGGIVEFWSIIILSQPGHIDNMVMRAHIQYYVYTSVATHLLNLLVGICCYTPVTIGADRRGRGRTRDARGPSRPGPASRWAAVRVPGRISPCVV